MIQKIEMLMNKALLKVIEKLRNMDVTEWEQIRYATELEYTRSIPEIRVVDALREYIDGVWSGPEESKRLWNKVLVAIKELDEYVENGFSKEKLHGQEKAS